MSYDLIFQELLVKDKLVSVHQMILQLIEIFKAKSGMLSELMNDIFHFVERPYHLRSSFIFKRKRAYVIYHGSGNLYSLHSKL